MHANSHSLSSYTCQFVPRHTHIKLIISSFRLPHVFCEFVCLWVCVRKRLLQTSIIPKQTTSVCMYACFVVHCKQHCVQHSHSSLGTLARFAYDNSGPSVRWTHETQTRQELCWHKMCESVAWRTTRHPQILPNCVHNSAASLSRMSAHYYG